MKTNSKINLFLLTVLLLTVLFPTTGQAKAEDDFIIKDGVLTSYIGTESKVTIPSNVKEIGENVFNHNDKIVKVIIPGNVENIGANAFSYCKNLKTVILEKGVKKIGIYAFSNDINLSEVSIPSTVSLIEVGNFMEAKWYKNYKKDFMIVGDGILLQYKGKALNISLPASVKVIHREAFHNYNDKLSQITMNKQLKTIESYTFSDFTKLKKISIPRKVTSIGEDAFARTPWLLGHNEKYLVVGDGILIQYRGRDKLIHLPTEVKTINTNVFAENNQITGIVIHNKVTKISSFAFYNCRNLRKVSLSTELTDIGNYAFSGSGITSIMLPKKTRNIGEGAFANCNKLSKFSFPKTSQVSKIIQHTFSDCISLQKLILPSSIIKIENEAFNGCRRLKTVILPDRVREIGQSSFYKCTSLETITIPKKITVLEPSLFEGCSLLKKVTFTGDITTIRENAFSGCTKLANVTVPTTVKSLERYSFYKCASLKSINLNSNIKSLPEGCFSGCSKLEKISFQNKNIEISSDALKGTKWLNAYPEDCVALGGKMFFYKGKALKVQIPKTITSIGDGAFYQNSGIEELEVPSTVKNINESAFYHCSKLKKVILPRTMKKIGAFSFKGCTSLEQVMLLEEENKGLSSEGSDSEIGRNAFEGCTKLKKVSLPENMQILGDNAFENCNSLIEITLPKQLTTIENSVFLGCSKLSTIHYEGTLVSLGKNVFNDTYYYKKSSDQMVMLRNALLKYKGNDTSVSIPDTCNIIAPLAFYNNKTIYEIKLPSTLTFLGAEAFRNCTKLKTVSMPESYFKVGYGAFHNTDWLNKQNNDFIVLKNGVLLKYQGKDTNVTIPDSVVEIAAGAFEYKKITKAIIPKSVKIIEDGAFSYSTVREVFIEDGVEEIGNSAFSECGKLVIIHIPDSVNKIGLGIFACEEANTNYVIECSKGSIAYDYAKAIHAKIKVK